MAIQRPHIIAIPLPAVGHINPLVHLCKRLESNGFEVTMLVPESVKLSTFLDGANSIQTRIVALQDGLPEELRDEAPATVMDAITRQMDSVQGMRPAAEEFIRSFYDDSKMLSCIVTDAFVPWPHDISGCLNVPVAVFSTHASITDLVLIHGRRLKEQGYLPAKLRRTGNKLLDFIPGIPASHPDDILLLSLGDDHPWLDYSIRAFEKMLEAKWILSSSFESMEPQAVKAFREHLEVKQYLTVGPFISEGVIMRQQSSEASLCLEWLDAQEQGSVIYISHGTLAILSPQQLMELAHGLEASGHKFVLVMRPSLVVDHENGFDVASFQERIKPRGYIISWAPQLEVLNHPAVAAFLTHCGWNSTMEAISAGVPMIAWPCVAEQNINCKIIEDRGLGVRIHPSVGRHEEPELLNREPIAEAIKSIMGDTGKAFKLKVEQLREELKNSLAPGGSSYTNLKKFCSEIISVK